METETTLARSIRTIDDKSKYDAACKQLLSEKIILAWIMKSCLEEYRDCDAKEIAEKYIEGQPQVGTAAVLPEEANAPPKIHGIGTEDASLSEGTIFYDIRFTALAPKSGELIKLIINVEAHNNFYPGYPITKRGIYYCCRMISSQHGTEFTKSEYGKIKKVYSIWVCASPPKKMENTITRYRITEENMVGNVHNPVQDYDLMTVILLCLGNSEGENYNGILKLLGTLLSSKTAATEKQQVLQEDFNIPMTETLERAVNEMCNLSEGIEARGIARGLEQGRAEGIEKGILSSLRNLMDSMGLTTDQAMNALKISEADRLKYRSLLDGQ